MLYEAVNVGQRASSGRALPPMVMAQSQDGQQLVEVFLKGPHFSSSKTFDNILEREWMAGRLASELGLPCARGCQVVVLPELIATVGDQVLRHQLELGPEVLFGSISAGPQWNVWTSATPARRAALPTMASIYLFDTLIDNFDRSEHSPNLLLHGDDFLMIDHGEAFQNASGTGGYEDLQGKPWLPAQLQNTAGFDQHIFWPRLRHRDMPEFTRAASDWSRLPGDMFAGIAAEIPSCWDRTTVNRITDYLCEGVEYLAAVLANIEEELQR
ncbi:HipA family kinase [Mangrovicoccus sp. HB161399]|uniref:HipA family kinase n=1 Tax=Mangrovicoccus sp. HB161399 TaxID=2720392 RepID=UPI00155638C3|nr:HipA family kinase [Mangrovicoccus sp. HB161399]